MSSRDDWFNEAYIALRAYLAGRKKAGKLKFLWEHFVAHVEEKLPALHQNHWGLLCMQASREGLIEFTGKAVVATKASRKRGLVREWQVI